MNNKIRKQSKWMMDFIVDVRMDMINIIEQEIKKAEEDWTS